VEVSDVLRKRQSGLKVKGRGEGITTDDKVPRSQHQRVVTSPVKKKYVIFRKDVFPVGSSGACVRQQAGDPVKTQHSKPQWNLGP